MEPITIVVAQSDTVIAEYLADSLTRHFHSVRLVSSLDELKSVIPRQRADVAIVDLDLAPLAQVERICGEFPVQVVCTHRIPDEKMWAAALSVGAIDCCQNSDVRGIVEAINRERTYHAAA